jgi:DNA-binding NtrC family response regulator
LTPFHILIIGDCSTDLLLIKKHLCKRWPALNIVQVESAEGVQKNLIEENWDCVLFDLCSDSGDDALKVLDQIRKTTPKLPFFII